MAELEALSGDELDALAKREMRRRETELLHRRLMKGLQQKFVNIWGVTGQVIGQVDDWNVVIAHDYRLTSPGVAEPTRSTTALATAVNVIQDDATVGLVEAQGIPAVDDKGQPVKVKIGDLKLWLTNDRRRQLEAELAQLNQATTGELAGLGPASTGTQPALSGRALGAAKARAARANKAKQKIEQSSDAS